MPLAFPEYGRGVLDLDLSTQILTMRRKLHVHDIGQPWAKAQVTEYFIGGLEGLLKV